MLKVNKKTGEIFLYGVIGPEDMGGDIDEMDFINALESLEGKRAHLRINSPGGHVDHGVSMYNAAKRYEGGVDVTNDSLAASIASVIAMAGEKRNTSDGARWMIHRARGGIMGTASQIRQYLDRLDSYDASIVDLYTGVLGKDAAEVGTMLDAETWFTSDAAVAAGLANGKAGKTNARPRIAAWFQNAPADFIAACATETVAELKPYPVARQAAAVFSKISRA